MSNSFNSDQTSDFPPQPEERTDPKGSGLNLSNKILWIVGTLVVVFCIGLGILFSNLTAKSTPNANVAPGRAAVSTRTVGLAEVSPTDDNVIKIYVLGEVQNPGVYEMKPGD